MNHSNGLIVELFDAFREVDGIYLNIQQKVQRADDSRIFSEFQQTLAIDEAEMFEGQHDSSGTSWGSLQPSTIKGQRNNRILFDSGALMASLVTVGGPGNVSGVAPRGLLFGTEVEYAIFHQDGTPEMPARPPVGIKPESLVKLTNAIADRTVENMRRVSP